MAQEFMPFSHPTSEKDPAENQEEFDKLDLQTPVDTTNRTSEKSTAAKSPLRSTGSSTAGEELGLLSAITGVALLQDSEIIKELGLDNTEAGNSTEIAQEQFPSQSDDANFEGPSGNIEELKLEPHSVQDSPTQVRDHLEAVSDAAENTQDLDTLITAEQNFLKDGAGVATEQVTGIIPGHNEIPSNESVVTSPDPATLFSRITTPIESVGTESNQDEASDEIIVDEAVIDLVDNPLDASDELPEQLIDENDIVGEEVTGTENNPVVVGDTSEDPNNSGNPTQDSVDNIIDGGEVIDQISGGVINDLIDDELGDTGIIDEPIGDTIDDGDTVDDLVDSVIDDGDIVDDLIDNVIDDDGIVGDLVDNILDDGGIVDDLVDNILDDGSIVDDLVDNILDDGGIVDDLVDNVIDDGGIVDDLVSSVIDDGGIVDDLAGSVIDDGGIVDQISGGVINDLVDNVVDDNSDVIVDDLVDNVPIDGGLVDDLIGDVLPDDGTTDDLVGDLLGSLTGDGEPLIGLNESTISDSSDNDLFVDLLDAVSSENDALASTDLIEDNVDPIPDSGLMGDLVGSLIGSEDPATTSDSTPITPVDDTSPVDGLLNDIDNSLFS